MKIALATCYFQHNYGSQLQAYATQRIFDRMNIPNETICIDGLRHDINSAKYRYFISHALQRNTIIDKWPTVRKAIRKRTSNRAIRSGIAIRDARFNDFASTMFHLSKQYVSKSDIADNYDGFIVGSDQLWLPSNIEADYYTLSFAPDNKMKMSLSTSFGVGQLPDRQARKASTFLKEMDAISVREHRGRELVKQLTGREAQIVCDPTLFFTADEWRSLMPEKSIVEKPYILCYFLGNDMRQRKFAAEVKRVTGLPIVMLPHCDDYIAKDNRLADISIYDAGPFDWIRLIHDAKYVLTDSFHATSFATLMSVPFLTFRRYRRDSSVSTNSRLNSLLGDWGLEGHIVTNYGTVDNYLHIATNFGEAGRIIEQQRTESQKWLCDNISLLCQQKYSI